MCRSKGLAVVLFGAALVFLGSNVKAESSKAEGVVWSPAAALCTTPSLVAASRSRPGDPKPGTLSVCTAQCDSGTVMCTGTSCSATDRNCPSTPGFCWSNLEGYKYCSPPCESYCTALCANGPNVTCSGTSCSATDSDCPSQVGFCWSNAEGYKYCQECEEEEGCTAQTYCGSSPLSCQGSAGTCSVSQGCWVQCDGNKTFCPGMDENCEEN
jgi:hypothetical protein